MVTSHHVRNSGNDRPSSLAIVQYHGSPVLCRRLRACRANVIVGEAKVYIILCIVYLLMNISSTFPTARPFGGITSHRVSDQAAQDFTLQGVLALTRVNVGGGCTYIRRLNKCKMRSWRICSLNPLIRQQFLPPLRTQIIFPL